MLKFKKTFASLLVLAAVSVAVSAVVSQASGIQEASRNAGTNREAPEKILNGWWKCVTDCVGYVRVEATPGTYWGTAAGYADKTFKAGACPYQPGQQIWQFAFAKNVLSPNQLFGIGSIVLVDNSSDTCQADTFAAYWGIVTNLMPYKMYVSIPRGFPSTMSFVKDENGP